MSPFLCILSCLVFGGVIETKTLLFQATDNKLCPDKQGNCPEGTTCCLLKSGKYGCCPFPDAVCCSDNEHCCPNGYTCDIVQQQCTKDGDEVIQWTVKTAVTPIIRKLDKVICPDQHSECDDGQTCCQLTSGSWGCCPLPQAVCCDDHEHCCPNGYTCNVQQQTCNRENGETVSWFKKDKATKINKKSEFIVCPGQQTECGDAQTCCLLASGGYGCCPLPQAVCCDDHEHCCPHGYTCDVPHQMCRQQNGEAVSWTRKVTASPIAKKSNSVICPDHQTQCDDGQTCCRLASGDWGCCPLPQAVCCSDHEHCCPRGTTCDVPHQRCVSNNKDSLSWFTTLKAKSLIQMVDVGKENIVCPDGGYCPDGSTCCLMTSGEYGCCPLPQATCCSDLIHCCPNGYSCDLQKQTCVREDGHEVSWSTKTPARSIAADHSICSDEKSRCQDGSVCCSNPLNGNHGCCPYENAVCCSDGLHCCPADTQCDVSSQMCQSNAINIAVSWQLLGKLVGSGFGSVKKNDVTCPDQKSHCPTDTTCCQMQSSLYGCCPYKEATCCEDKLHCCPNGYTCDVAHSTCIPKASGVALPWEMFGHSRAKKLA